VESKIYAGSLLILVIDKLLDKDVAKQKISKDEVAGTKERMSTTTNIEDIADVDYVIEAVPVFVSTI
jgi:3-hydroxyacyl-CoA dehydrogenase